MEWWQVLLIVLGSVFVIFTLTIVLYRQLFKRLWDIILSFFAIIILIPLYIVISLLVLIFMGHPVIFSQDRIGKNGKTFKLFKFRSMTNKKDENGNLLPEDQRLTRFGRILRSTSLDELPELWLIFIGKMSFVGPRPQPTYYGPYYYPEERIIHKVRGGLIPPDSLSKKDVTTWEEQLEYEMNYAKRITFLKDIKIIFWTVIILFKRLKNDYGNEPRPHLNDYRKDDERLKEINNAK